MSKCKDCKFWGGGNYDDVGQCHKIASPHGGWFGKARIYPVGTGWLETVAEFGCNEYEKEKT